MGKIDTLNTHLVFQTGVMCLITQIMLPTLSVAFFRGYIFNGDQK